MPRNGNGTFVPSATTFNPAVAGTTIDPGSGGWETTLADLAAGLTQSVSKDGQTVLTGNINYGGSFKNTNMANGTAATDSATLGQVAAAAYSVAAVGGTADAIALTPSPAITAYATGQNFQFTAGSTNTTAVTVAVSGLATKAVQANSAALVAGDIVSGRTYVIRYDGTAFQLFSSRAAITHLAELDRTGTVGQVLTGVAAGTAPVWSAPFGYVVCNGRLTQQTGTPIPTGSGGGTTIYFTPYLGNKIGVYNGTGWQINTFTELSIATPSTTNTNYDVFYDYNSGTPQLSLTAWTNSTTRATALTTQDGVYVLTGTLTKRYLGTIRTGASSGTADNSATKRFIWNYYNRVPVPVGVSEGTDTWTYSASAFQQANANTANQVEMVCGFREDLISLQISASASGSATNQIVAVGIGVNSTSAIGGTTGPHISAPVRTQSTTVPCAVVAMLTEYIAREGYSFYAWLEAGNGSGTQTWYGDNGLTNSIHSGMTGTWRC